MEKLSIFKIEDAEIEDTEALRVELFPGEDPEDAVTAFTAVVFQNSMAILYHRLKAKLGDKDVWEANGDFTDCIRVTGTAERVKVPKEFYRFTKNSEGKTLRLNQLVLLSMRSSSPLKADQLSKNSLSVISLKYLIIVGLKRRKRKRRINSSSLF